jgi:hypothetical protein
MKNLIALGFTIILAACVTVFPTHSATAQAAQSYWVFDGTSLSVVHRDPATVQAPEWAAFYFRKSAPAGTMSQRWGIDTGKSAAEVLRKVAANQRFERQYEKWCECSWGSNTFFNVIAPVALSKGPVLTPLSEITSARVAATYQHLHAGLDRILKYRDLFNHAATLAGEQKLPTVPGPFAEFMSNIHKALDRWHAFNSEMEGYYNSSSEQLKRTLEEFLDAVAVVNKNADPALRLLENKQMTTTASWRSSTVPGNSWGGRSLVDTTVSLDASKSKLMIKWHEYCDPAFTSTCAGATDHPVTMADVPIKSVIMDGTVNVAEYSRWTGDTDDLDSSERRVRYSVGLHCPEQKDCITYTQIDGNVIGLSYVYLRYPTMNQAQAALNVFRSLVQLVK